jgi:ankyrin repeat protein
MGEVKSLINQGANVGIPDSNGRFPLECCLLSPHLWTDKDELRKTVQMLLDHGADPTCQNPMDGTTPLHLASDPIVIFLLLQKGANPNAKDWHGRTPLHFSVLNKPNIDRISTLLANGAKLNIGDNDNKTPVDYVAEMCRTTTDRLYYRQIDALFFMWQVMPNAPKGINRTYAPSGHGEKCRDATRQPNDTIWTAGHGTRQ